jgi:urea carboxylase-associated protein 2
MDTYTTNMTSGSHWSLVVRKGVTLTLKDLSGGSNVAMLFFNPQQLTEKYNAPDTLKCQHTFKLTKGNCLYSEMGRIFCSITDDSFGWHETLCGNSHASHVEKQWGKRDYQTDRNDWLQNGVDSFLVEMAKYNLKKQDMAANVNWFSEVSVDETGNMSLSRQAKAGDHVTLRFEMDTLVMLHTCPHPMNQSDRYPDGQVEIKLAKAAPVADDDFCKNWCNENRRGFMNNDLYHFGMEA